MGILTKNIPKAEQDLSNIPEGLIVRRRNAIRAGYNFEFDAKEKKYIAYNKLRVEKPQDEIVQVAKIYRLKNRDNDKEYLVWVQTSKTYDYEGNLVKCPHTEQIGVEDAEQTIKHRNSQNQIIDIETIETQNDFYVEYTEDKLKSLFEKSRNSQNITCYIGYCKPVQEMGTDFITDKKRIHDQVLFITEDFEDLFKLTDKSNVVNTYSKVKRKMPKLVDAEGKTKFVSDEEYQEEMKKRRDNNELPKIGSTSTPTDKPRRYKRLNKTSEEIQAEENETQAQQEKEQGIKGKATETQANIQNEQEQAEAEVDAEENDDNTESDTEGNGNGNGKLKIGSLD